MSSKSRKNTPKPGSKRQQPAAHEGHGGHGGHAPHAEGDHAEPTAEDFLEAEELLKTPKGKSPLLFGFLILLLIFLLIVFVAGDAFYASQRSMGLGRAVMRWEHPTAGPQEVSARDFRMVAEKLDYARGAGPRVDDEAVAGFIVLDRLAKDAGVRVGTQELRERLEPLVEQFGSIEAYRARFARFPGNVAGFESFLRDDLAIQRLRALLNSFTAVPDVDQLLESWATQNQLHSFDVAYAVVEDYRAVALAEEPDDATLQAWLDGLSDFQKREYERPASRRIELVGALFTDAGRSFDALLAAYPEIEEVDAQARARDYYDRSFFTRFRRDEPIPEDAPDAPDDPTARLYLPFDEVVEQATFESAVFGALQRWREDVAGRIADGEELDLAAEAERLGLDLQAPGGTVTQPELREMDGLGGLYIAGPLFGLQQPGTLTAGVTIGADGLAVGRVLEIVPASLPAAAEIRDELLEPWADARAVALATEALEALRADLDELAGEGAEDAEDDGTLVVDGEAFRAAAEAAGFAVERVEDFDRADLPAEPSATERFLRSAFVPFTLPDGGVDAVRKGFDGERVYLTRHDSSRDPDPSSLTARDFQTLLQRPSFPVDDPFSTERLRERYGLWLESDSFDQGGAAGDGPDAP